MKKQSHPEGKSKPQPAQERTAIQTAEDKSAPPTCWEVASIVSQYAEETLQNWLLQNGAPEEALVLLAAACFLRGYEVRAMLSGEASVKWFDNDTAAEMLPAAMNAVTIMGGEWHDTGGSSTLPRKSPTFKRNGHNKSGEVPPVK